MPSRTLAVFLCWLLAIKLVSGIRCWVCDNVRSEEECQLKGHFKNCPISETMCHIEIRKGGWGEQPMIEKSCKTTTACDDNFVQNAHNAWSIEGDQVQCNNHSPSSVCRCCCATEDCNYNVLSCDRIEKCPTISTPAGGTMQCTDGFRPLSRCTFKCNRHYGLVGAKFLHCNHYGKWDGEVPVCRRLTCQPPLYSPQFGSMRCTNGVNWLSVCEFSCETGYRLHGGQRVQCVEDLRNIDDEYGLWTRTQPVCKPKRCPELKINHGIYTCDNDNYVGSRCSLRCTERGEYTIYPKNFTRAVCQRNEKWTATACCGLPCPPYAIMDFVIVLDSSSSVREENWRKMKKFVRSFLSAFVVRPDSSHFAVIRYNREVDKDTQILLNSYPNSTQAVLEKFDEIPYDGSGTHTGKALKYASDVLLKVGNREIANDVVLLITDGASQDDVELPSKMIRDKALFYVLPIKPPKGSLNITEIELMAGEDRYVLRDAIERGFDALDIDFARKITRLLCRNPCKNPFHGHD